MTRRQRRATFIGLGVGILCVAVFLVLFALRDAVVGFHFPKEVAEKQIPAGGRIRLGGVVAADSIKRGEGLTVQFGITDNVKTIPVSYTGILPDLFREGQGVVTEGKLDPTGRFIADTVLAKHDENYMPPEAAIHAFWRGDLYIVLGDALAGGAFVVRAYFNPLVRLIWLGAIVMALGGALAPRPAPAHRRPEAQRGPQGRRRAHARGVTR